MPDLAASAKTIIDSNQYMTLGTADREGRPWASPVWFAHEGYTRFVWVSKPEARHSRNLVERPQAGIVIFDSTVPMGNGQAVYVEAEVEQLEDDEAERGIAVFSSRSREFGGREWSVADVRPPARLRLFLATASAQFVLDPNDERLAVSLA
jgi:pyridoxine/pyridoxamine 5'-phosphate oxidase